MWKRYHFSIAFPGSEWSAELRKMFAGIWTGFAFLSFWPNLKLSNLSLTSEEEKHLKLWTNEYKINCKKNMREIWAKKLWLLKSSLEHQMDKDQSLRKSTYNAFQMSVRSDSYVSRRCCYAWSYKCDKPALSDMICRNQPMHEQTSCLRK